jgi:cell filamentation protein
VIEHVDPYLYPGTRVLRNRLGITDSKELDRIERRLVLQRIKDGAPGGSFDLTHLQAIHRHLFRDVYDWAGELRTLEINKGGHQFQFRQYIQTGMADVHRRLRSAKFLRGLGVAEFSDQAGVIIGDINYVHPFREGNGRTQMQYLQQLAAQAGHDLDLARMRPKFWIEASKASFAGDYSVMAKEITRTIVGPFRNLSD